MSNHFTGLDLGPPLDDQRLDLCDLYAFQSHTDPSKTVLILNANPSTNGFHPDAIYRLNIADKKGHAFRALSFVFSPLQNGSQTANVFLASGDEAQSPEAVGTKIISDAAVSFDAEPNIIKTGNYTFCAGLRSDAFFFDYDGVLALFDTSGGRNFTAPHLGGKAPWTGVDANATANIFSIVIELPTSELCSNSAMHIWGRCSLHRDGELVHADRAGHPSVSSFFNTDETKEEFNASEPVNDYDRWLEQFIHLLGHTGDYSREEAIEAINDHAILPDMLSFDPSRPAAYPHGH